MFYKFRFNAHANLFESYAELGECSTTKWNKSSPILFESYAELGECSTELIAKIDEDCLRVMLN